MSVPELSDAQRAFMAALPVAVSDADRYLAPSERLDLFDAGLITWEPAADEWWPTDKALDAGLT